jgi:hypothetical protein
MIDVYCWLCLLFIAQNNGILLTPTTPCVVWPNFAASYIVEIIISKKQSIRTWGNNTRSLNYIVEHQSQKAIAGSSIGSMKLYHSSIFGGFLL